MSSDIKTGMKFTKICQFSGGIKFGRCIQLTQKRTEPVSPLHSYYNSVSFTKNEVRELRDTLNKWLEDNWEKDYETTPMGDFGDGEPEKVI
jgi:hypothetical protein